MIIKVELESDKYFVKEFENGIYFIKVSIFITNILPTISNRNNSLLSFGDSRRVKVNGDEICL